MKKVLIKLYAKCKMGFTLAEVLITLGIIGITASITLSSIIQKQQVKHTSALLKKTYTELSQVMLRINEDYGVVSEWGINDNDKTNEEKHNIIHDIFKSYLKFHKDCYIGYGKDNTKCMKLEDFSTYKLSGTKDGGNLGYVAFILNNGARIGINIPNYTTNCNNIQEIPCVNVKVATDNKKLISGKNLFYFYIYDSRVLPAGYPDINYSSFDNNCIKQKNGVGCTAWVMYNENLDYLYCDDLSWEGKRSCK